MKIFIQLIIVLLINFTCYSQSIVQLNTICDNEVSTNWQNPSNENLPLWDHDNNASTPKILDTRFLNGLDWVNGNTGGNGYSTNGMFFTENEPYGNMTNLKPITNPNPWYHYLYYGDDLTSENGWEILLHNLGMYPSRLKLQFNWFCETDFALNGRQLTLEEELTNSSVKELVNKDYLGSFEYIGEDVTNGFVIYQSLEKAIDDYIKQMENMVIQI